MKERPATASAWARLSASSAVVASLLRRSLAPLRALKAGVYASSSINLRSYFVSRRKRAGRRPSSLSIFLYGVTFLRTVSPKVRRSRSRFTSSSPCARSISANARASPGSPRPLIARSIWCRAWIVTRCCGRSAAPRNSMARKSTLDLAERLIADAGGREDELPLIQHGLMLTWHQAVAAVHPSDRIVLDASPLEAAGGLAKLLSSHADAVLQTEAPDAERRFAVERLFRALTDVNVEGKAIRRPQSFRSLVAVTDISADALRGIIEALRSDGVSFLTPYSPHPITDATPIDISHEALIRCWVRLADPRDGWLKREFDDGLIWRLLLVEARSFERDDGASYPRRPPKSAGTGGGTRNSTLRGPSAMAGISCLSKA